MTFNLLPAVATNVPTAPAVVIVRFWQAHVAVPVLIEHQNPVSPFTNVQDVVVKDPTTIMPAKFAVVAVAKGPPVYDPKSLKSQYELFGVVPLMNVVFAVIELK